MIKTQNIQKPLNPFQSALAHIRKNRWAVLCSRTLVAFYLAAIFADFLSPYSYQNEDRNSSYAPPSRIHFLDENHGFGARECELEPTTEKGDAS